MDLKKDFKNLKVGDVIYHINPSGWGLHAQRYVEIETMKITKIEKSFLGIFGHNILHYITTDYNNRTTKRIAYISDMTSRSSRFTTMDKELAEKHLNRIRTRGYILAIPH